MSNEHDEHEHHNEISAIEAQMQIRIQTASQQTRDEMLTQFVRKHVRHVPVAAHAAAIKVVPPVNFAMVEPGVYRSGKPAKHSLPFLATLHHLSDSPDQSSNIEWAHDNQISYFHFPIKENKEPFQQIDQQDLAKALVEVLGLLFFFLREKHRCGCLVGCLRKLEKWSMASIFDEYQRFSGNKIYIADQQVKCEK
ncbi:hypothetical protein HK100_003224 [Physocladia obscura]|uniref:Uncharacterized protein n=1 Tax=Physocladia obscura TaxID=109957 RepID=A0AAD5XAK2_9FUNG|nr:hypothetical protein HK100_003224 [Physocladia obscura]